MAFPRFRPAALLSPLLLGFAAALPAPALAFDPPPRESTLVIFGDDPCPTSQSDNEVVVCARRPEEERYRIPRRIREAQPIDTSWGSRVASLDDESRPMRPDSCSVVGSYGFTGCTGQMLRQWYAERRARRAEENSRP